MSALSELLNHPFATLKNIVLPPIKAHYISVGKNRAAAGLCALELSLTIPLLPTHL